MYIFGNNAEDFKESSPDNVDQIFRIGVNEINDQIRI